MKQVELIMPKMGESIAEATILKWLKKEGEMIEMDEVVLEIATDKVDSEVPSPISGKLSKILFNENDVVAVGKAIAIIELEGLATSPEIEVPHVPVAQTIVSQNNQPISISQKSTPPLNGTVGGNRFYSPLVLNIAKSEGISMQELESVPGTGGEGRVSKKDILAYLKDRGNIQLATNLDENKPLNNPVSVPVQETETVQSQNNSSPSNKTSAPSHVPMDVSLMPGDEIIEMDRMRKLIADHMVMSKHVSPHVTSFVEADVTNMVLWRDRIKKDFEKREGEKITFTPLFVEAVAKAIKDFPNINVSVSGTSIVKRKSINIGMAAALPSGNLIVPVIKNADTKNLLGLTKDVNSLANKARNNQLKPDDIQGGTFTLTNVGTFGNVMGTPIINQPQAAILAVGAIKKKPVVLETPQGDVIAIRHMMFLSLSYDHRVVDGMLGGSFLRKVADYLEQFDINRVL